MSNNQNSSNTRLLYSPTVDLPRNYNNPLDFPDDHVRQVLEAMEEVKKEKAAAEKKVAENADQTSPTKQKQPTKRKGITKQRQSAKRQRQTEPTKYRDFINSRPITSEQHNSGEPRRTEDLPPPFHTEHYVPVERLRRNADNQLYNPTRGWTISRFLPELSDDLRPNPDYRVNRR
ncbi:hypothetical protein FSPOR_6110 [Fusarium sporotrichioides]|uniref:Uncharacterized protein n=1 Tax=Fusarium sporotrichioides TaxID=5514 RepID=A0A395S4R1_FUSSP|nr:hypothetical protein FSPOR_6110 [Fusarium sporotrichioides]